MSGSGWRRRRSRRRSGRHGTATAATTASAISPSRRRPGARPGYRRELDLPTAVAEVSYTADGVRHVREHFVSHPDRVIVVRLGASRPGQVAFTAAMALPAHRTATTIAANGRITVAGRLTDNGLRFEAPGPRRRRHRLEQGLRNQFLGLAARRRPRPQDAREQLRTSTLGNLWDTHPPFQIYGKFGATAGVIEMLLQSHGDEVHILPALPALWPSGRVSGLRARGDLTVGIAWESGAAREISVTAGQARPDHPAKPVVRCGFPIGRDQFRSYGRNRPRRRDRHVRRPPGKGLPGRRGVGAGSCGRRPACSALPRRRVGTPARQVVFASGVARRPRAGLMALGRCAGVVELRRAPRPVLIERAAGAPCVRDLVARNGREVARKSGKFCP
ncbi:glycoside hydrolase N-terminal domain-containing protein [Actinoplanes subtropicus]|uniref:glycoside hydrolase N-terminal domain-containing protein n=1 Tax=Actinoplanes subtropicus TaxID=543632 RepID=UPI001FDF498D|nr:glycoside hydrolase N-terminal domain-containing protein [Actinoplanes subtropicus]